MNETLITITDAASISGKSIQTIRRAIKAKKIKVKKQKTPQGFNYLIVKDTLVECYQIQEKPELREIPIERHADEPVIRLDIQETSREMGSMEEVRPEIDHALLAEKQAEIARTEQAIRTLDEKINAVVSTYSNEREQVTQVLKDFKDRILVLENQVRMIQAPKKNWYQFWR